MQKEHRRRILICQLQRDRDATLSPPVEFYRGAMALQMRTVGGKKNNGTQCLLMVQSQLRDPLGRPEIRAYA